MQRSVRLVVLSLVCALVACDADDRAPVGAHDVGTVSLASWQGVLPSSWALGTDCATPDCHTLRLTVAPAPIDPDWTIDGTRILGPSHVDIPAPPVGGFIEVEVLAEGRIATQIITNMGDVDNTAGIIILGSQDDGCFRFYVRSVGGCLIQPDGITFERAVNGVFDPPTDVMFDTDPIDLVLEGHSTYARWTISPGVMVDDGRTPPLDTMPPSFLDGVEYWYSLADGEFADMYAIHGPAGAPELLQRSTCAQGGLGALTPTP